MKYQFFYLLVNVNLVHQLVYVGKKNPVLSVDRRVNHDTEATAKLQFDQDARLNCSPVLCNLIKLSAIQTMFVVC